MALIEIGWIFPAINFHWSWIFQFAMLKNQRVIYLNVDIISTEGHLISYLFHVTLISFFSPCFQVTEPQLCRSIQICIWYVYDMYMICIWYIYIYDMYMICIWYVYDMYMICICMICTWYVHDMYIICIWYIHDIYIHMHDMYIYMIYIYIHMHDMYIYICIHDFRFFVVTPDFIWLILMMNFLPDMSHWDIYKILYGLQPSHVLSTCKFMLKYTMKKCIYVDPTWREGAVFLCT